MRIENSNIRETDLARISREPVRTRPDAAPEQPPAVQPEAETGDVRAAETLQRQVHAQQSEGIQLAQARGLADVLVANAQSALAAHNTDPDRALALLR